MLIQIQYDLNFTAEENSVISKDYLEEISKQSSARTLAEYIFKNVPLTKLPPGAHGNERRKLAFHALSEEKFTSLCSQINLMRDNYKNGNDQRAEYHFTQIKFILAGE